MATAVVFRDSAETADRVPAGHGGEQAEKVEITPQIAAAWLDRHNEVVARNRVAAGGTARDNRPVRFDDVERYARDMRAGRWNCNGETIKRARDGSVPDGQHRHLACIQAGTPFTTWVVSGVEPGYQDTMDIGRRRTMSDQLHIGNEKNPVVLASVARWALRWLHDVRTGTPGGGSKFNPTNAEILAFIAIEPRLRDAAAFAVAARKSFKPVRSSVYAMAWMLFTGLDLLAARVFLDRVVDGTDLAAGHPALAFRTRMSNAAANRERLTEAEQLALLCTAWNAFRDDELLSNVQLPKGGLTAKNFPEPK